MDGNIEAQVARLRAEGRAKRAALPPEALAEASRRICARVRATEVWRQAGSVMGYMAVRGEPSVLPLLAEALSCGKTLLLPRTEDGGVITARRVTDLRALIPGAYGIPEPPPQSELFPPEEIGLLLVPGVAFSASGARIGQGGGYYDRFLPRCRGFALGVCHDFALLGELPRRAHDARVHAVATPSALCDCREERL